MPLTDLQCSKAKATGKEYTKLDGDGLHLLIRAKGTKSWLCDFVRGGKRIKYNYGQYPAISLEQARRLHAIARQLAEQGRHPSELLDNEIATGLILSGKSLNEIEADIQIHTQSQTKASRPTFEQAAERFKTDWVDRNWKHPDKGYIPVRKNLLPTLGGLALDDIDTPTLRELLHSIREHRGEQAALHARGWCSRIFDFAIEHDWCKLNPAKNIKPERIGTKGKRTRWLQTQEIRRYLACLYQSSGYRGYKLALHLLLILASRKGELCGAAWAEFDLNAGEWIIPDARMKTGKEHRVYLPRQAIEMLQELHRLSCGSDWVMPMPTNPKRPMNGNNLDGTHHAALLAAGIEDYVIHDHRHTASTHLREQGYNPEVVETALSHAIGGMAGTYSHAEYKTQRLEMMQSWADFLDTTMNEYVVLSATFRKAA